MESFSSYWTQMIRPYKIEFEKEEIDSHKATVLIEPLERGFGITLGNALRRVLLSSIQGSAVIAVKIQGVVLEFSHLPGVLEDVPDIILNLKALNIRLNQGESETKATFKNPDDHLMMIGSAISDGSENLDPSKSIGIHEIYKKSDLTPLNPKISWNVDPSSLDLLNGEDHLRNLEDTPSLHTHWFSISVKGPCVVTAKDIQCAGRLEILDPHQIICTVNQDIEFKAEICVAKGKGYVPAPLISSQHNKTIGEIMIDARFNPVRNVTFSVDRTRVAQSTDYDRLILSVETNGSIHPKEAISEAAFILQEQLRHFVSFKPQVHHVQAPSSDYTNHSKPNQALYMLVKDLDLPVRCLNCLKNANIVYVGDLVKKREMDLLRTPNFGKKSLNDIYEVLGRYGLTLGMENVDWPPYESLETFNPLS